MATSNNLNAVLVEQSQAQKEVTINEAFMVLEAIQNRGIMDKDLSSPPGSPIEGDAYIVAASATGDWLGQENNIAYFNQIWRFITPNEGLVMWVNDEDKIYYFDGTNWQSYNDNLQNLSLLGVNSTADSTNKLSVSSAAILFNHDGDDIQMKANKNAVGDTASFLFQTNFSGRAEFGLIGDDNFTLKTSPDGSTFTSALVLDKDDASITIAGGCKIVCGSGTPESNITAPVGSIYLRSGGGAGTSFYVKESGTGNTGWVAK